MGELAARMERGFEQTGIIARIEIQDAELETGLRSIRGLYDTKTRSPTHNLGMGGSPFILFYSTITLTTNQRQRQEYI